MDIIWFEKKIVDDGLTLEEKKEIINSILRANHYEEKDYSIYCIGYEDKENDIDVILSFFELFFRVRLKNESIIIFRNTLSICDDYLRVIRNAKKYEKFRNVSGIFFPDISYQPFSKIKDKLKAIFRTKDSAHSGARKKIRDLLPNTLTMAEKLFWDDSEERVLGHDKTQLRKYDSKSKYVSVNNIANFLQVPTRSLSKILSPASNDQQGRMILSNEQAELLMKAMEVDYTKAQERLGIQEMHGVIQFKA